MNEKEFNLGGGLSLHLIETSNIYYGSVNINIWRELMPEGTLRSGLETVNWDLDFDDFRNDKRAMYAFLEKLSKKLNRKVYLFSKTDLDSAYAAMIEARGGRLYSFMITIRK